MGHEKNYYEIREDGCYIRLDRKDGKPYLWTIIDVADMDLVLGFPNKWCAIKNPSTGNFYVAAHCDPAVYGKTTMYMHDWIMQPESPLGVNHIQQDQTFDNRRYNLENVSRSENMRKRRGYGTSKYIGVRRHKRDQKWVVEIRKPNGEQKHLGYFTDEIDAAIAYDHAAIHYYDFGKSSLNFLEMWRES